MFQRIFQCSMSNLKEYLDALANCLERNEDASTAVEKLLDALLSETDADVLRKNIPELTDWSIPTRIQLAMHVRLLQIGRGHPNDIVRFADFLDLFYEEMGEWAAALRRSISRNS